MAHKRLRPVDQQAQPLVAQTRVREVQSFEAHAPRAGISLRPLGPWRQPGRQRYRGSKTKGGDVRECS